MRGNVSGCQALRICIFSRRDEIFGTITGSVSDIVCPRLRLTCRQCQGVAKASSAGGIGQCSVCGIASTDLATGVVLASPGSFPFQVTVAGSAVARLLDMPPRQLYMEFQYAYSVKYVM